MERTTNKKRDRWASSSDDDDDDDRNSNKLSTQKSRTTKKKGNDVEQPPPLQQQQQQLISPSSIPSLSSTGNVATTTANTTTTTTTAARNTTVVGCRSVYDTYEKIERISEGSYGIVWKARCVQPSSIIKNDDSTTDTIVALKQMKFPNNDSSSSSSNMSHGSSVWKDGFPLMALREINALFHLCQHPNIVTLHEIVVGGVSHSSSGSNSNSNSGSSQHKYYVETTIPPQIYMVMDYYTCDLKTAIQQYTTQIVAGPLLQSELMGIIEQIIEGIKFMHQCQYIHRDLKPSNILVKPIFGGNNTYCTSRIAIADLGLTRKRRHNDNHTNMTLPVVTLWYRAPELLFGQTQYSSAIDMWSIGCIMGELVRSSGYSNTSATTTTTAGGGIENEDEEEYNNSCALLKGRGELDQIDAIFQLLGVPNDRTWPSFASLPNSKLLRWKPIPDHEILFPKLFPTNTGSGMTLLSNQTYLDQNGYDLLRQLLQLDPSKRINSSLALRHPYFTKGNVKPTMPDFSFLS